MVLEGLLVAAGRRGEGTRWRDGVRQNQRHDEAGVCVCVQLASILDNGHGPDGLSLMAARCS